MKLTIEIPQDDLDKLSDMARIASHVTKRKLGIADVVDDAIRRAIQDKEIYTYYGKWPNVPILYQLMHSDGTRCSQRLFHSRDEAEQWLRGTSHVVKDDDGYFRYVGEPDGPRAYISPVYLLD